MSILDIFRRQESLEARTARLVLKKLKVASHVPLARRYKLAGIQGVLKRGREETEDLFQEFTLAMENRSYACARELFDQMESWVPSEGWEAWEESKKHSGTAHRLGRALVREAVRVARLAIEGASKPLLSGADPANEVEHAITLDLLLFYKMLTEKYVNEGSTLAPPENGLFFRSFMEGVGTQLALSVPITVARCSAEYWRSKAPEFRQYDLILPIGDRRIQPGDKPFVVHDLLDLISDRVARAVCDDGPDLFALRLLVTTNILMSLESAGFDDAFRRLGAQAVPLLAADD